MQATAAALGGNGLLILGKSGAGKSTLALDLIALGGELIADDLIELSALGQRLRGAPVRHAGMIEARGIGLLSVPRAHCPHAIDFVIDLDTEETERLPKERTKTMLGVDLPCLHRPRNLSVSALAVMMRGGGLLKLQDFI